MFCDALRDHPVPLLEAAIRQLRDRSMWLDIYVWLAWRCTGWQAHGDLLARPACAVRRRLQGDPAVQAAVHGGAGSRPRRLSGGRVDLGEKAITLHPARPPIARIA